jgi:hypothetical protein
MQRIVLPCNAGASFSDNVSSPFVDTERLD